jgi:phosphoribosylformylglycinamidine synthase subunit PurL
VASDFKIRKDGYWFGEAQSRVVVSVAAGRVAEFTKAVGELTFTELGVVTAGSFEVDGMDWGMVAEWKEKYDRSLENYMSKIADTDAL